MRKIKDSFEEHPFAWMYGVIGMLSISIGILTSDEIFSIKEDITLGYLYGLSISIIGCVLLIAAIFYLKTDELYKKIEQLERDNLLEDLQQEK